MCRRVQCGKCNRPTYAGCGAHIEQVLGNVPPAERCQCGKEKSSSQTSATVLEPSWLRKLFSK